MGKGNSSGGDEVVEEDNALNDAEEMSDIDDEGEMSYEEWDRTVRNWQCDITLEEHRHFTEQHCKDTRQYIARKAARMESERLASIVREQEQVLEMMAARTEEIKRKTAERRVELIALRAARAQRNRDKAPRAG